MGYLRKHFGVTSKDYIYGRLCHFGYYKHMIAVMHLYVYGFISNCCSFSFLIPRGFHSYLYWKGIYIYIQSIRKK